MTPDKLKKIKAFLMDCDGVLTDGTIWIGPDGHWCRSFNMRDGHGIKEIIREGYIVGIVTGSTAADIQKRAAMLGIKLLYEGVTEKVSSYEDFKSRHSLKDEEILYMGDDEVDVPVLKACGFSVAPQNAHSSAKSVVDLVTEELGGEGCVRAVCDMLLRKSK